MKVALCQMEVRPGRPADNLKQALALLQQAEASGANLALLPEMAMPGYLLGDLWERPAFLKDCESIQEELIARTRSGLILAFGGLAVDWNKKNEDGRPRKYNAFFLAQNGQLISPQHSLRPYLPKTLLPNYREFDDSRHFTSLAKLATEEGRAVEDLLQPFIFTCQGHTHSLGGMLCEDGWSDDYPLHPAQILAQKGCHFLANLSCSPFTLGKNQKRHRVFSTIARSTGIPLFYCNCTGTQNNGKNIYTFDGDSTTYLPAGRCASTLAPYQTGVETIDLATARPDADPAPRSDPEQLLDGLLYGCKNFMAGLNLSKVVIGVSGGIDSALSAALFAQICAPGNLLLVNMPSRFNCDSTKSAAADLATRLNRPYLVSEVQPAFELAVRELRQLGDAHPELGLHCEGLVLENIQARDRSARILAALASAFGGVFTCNANKSEMTVGYATLYGDMAGFMAPLADLWKHQVYAISRLINKRAGKELIPRTILDMLPSAELSEQQNPEKGQGDPLAYDYHDALFASWVEDWQRKSPEDILQWYLAGELEARLALRPGRLGDLFPTAADFVADLERWWRNYTGLGLAKRIQSPPILALSRRALGFDHRESQIPLQPSRRYQELKQKVLQS